MLPTKKSWSAVFWQNVDALNWEFIEPSCRFFGFGHGSMTAVKADKRPPRNIPGFKLFSHYSRLILISHGMCAVYEITCFYTFLLQQD